MTAERNIGAEVRELVSVVVKMAKYLDDPIAAQLLTERAGSADTVASIVIAGEAKQGKSSLVNALVGSELSPVNADIATAAPVRLRYGPELRVTVNSTTGKEVDIAAAELPSWVSMTDAQLDQLRQVASVDIALPSPLLEPGVVLIDTPGVGGLVAGHAAMTLRSLESATAMLFVTDADTKLTRPELDFLARAGERIAAVVFVLTKIDATPNWKAVLQENREVLARHAPRYATAPVVPVSARLAARARAAAATDRPLSANLWAESGLGQLQGWISSRIRPVATTLAVANTVAVTRGTIDRLIATAQRNVDAATADPAITAAFEAEQARVTELRNEQSRWGTALERQVFEARIGLRDQIKRSSEALRRGAEEAIRTTRGRDAKQFVARLDADLEAQAQEVSAALSATAGAMCTRMLTNLNLASPLTLSVGEPGEVNVKPFERAADGALTMLTGGMAAVTGWSLIARLATSYAIGGVLGTVALPLAGALGMGYVTHHIRGGATGKAELRSWARAEIDRATSDRYADVERVLIATKLDIMEVVRAGLVEREREVAAALEVAKTARARSEADRAAYERNHRKVLAAAHKCASTADELLNALLGAAALTAPNAAGMRPAARVGR